ncbi:hypothetical protein LCGC14_1692590, partial [marine sediment metagenome]
YVRDAKTGKPLIWDSKENRPKSWDAPDIKEPTLAGQYEVNGTSCSPAFQLIKDHVKQYTPEQVSQITTVPAATIRRIAREFAEAARIAKINDPSSFITRRVTLGGIGAVAAIGGVGGAAAGAGLGPVGILVVALGARKMAKILADPEALKALTRSFRPGISEAQKRALMVRVLRQIGETTKNQAELEREARS